MQCTVNLEGDLALIREIEAAVLTKYGKRLVIEFSYQIEPIERSEWDEIYENMAPCHKHPIILCRVTNQPQDCPPRCNEHL